MHVCSGGGWGGGTSMLCRCSLFKMWIVVTDHLKWGKTKTKKTGAVPLGRLKSGLEQQKWEL